MSLLGAPRGSIPWWRSGKAESLETCLHAGSCGGVDRGSDAPKYLKVLLSQPCTRTMLQNEQSSLSRGQDEIPHRFIEGVWGDDQRRPSLRGAEIGEREGDENDVAAFIACRRRHRPGCSRSRSSCRRQHRNVRRGRRSALGLDLGIAQPKISAPSSLYRSRESRARFPLRSCSCQPDRTPIQIQLLPAQQPQLGIPHAGIEREEHCWQK